MLPSTALRPALGSSTSTRPLCSAKLQVQVRAPGCNASSCGMGNTRSDELGATRRRARLGSSMTAPAFEVVSMPPTLVALPETTTGLRGDDSARASDPAEYTSPPSTHATRLTRKRDGPMTLDNGISVWDLSVFGRQCEVRAALLGSGTTLQHHGDGTCQEEIRGFTQK